MIADDPFGGEPMAVVATNLTAVPGTAGKKPEDVGGRPGKEAGNERPNRYDGPGQGAGQDGAPAATPATAGRTITIIDGSSGRRQDVVIPGPADNKSSSLDP